MTTYSLLRQIILGWFLFLPIFAFATPISDNTTCLNCHDGRKRIDVPDHSPYADEGSLRPLVTISPDRYAKGSHAPLACKQCHSQITSEQPPHQPTPATEIDCAGCHEKLEKNGNTPPRVSQRLEEISRNIDKYRRSFHARPNKDDPHFINATCHDCHDSHFFNIPTDKNSPEYLAWRLTIPELCGKCHDKQLEDFNASIHGTEINQKKNANSAICTDCHTTHEITGALLAPFKLLNPDACGQCHQKNLGTYRTTYHGQVTKLGYPHTAKCFDCHENHKIQPVKDAKSTVHPNNRLKTCQKCHDGTHRSLATEGFKTFSPHAHGGDYERYPQVWIASRLMSGLFVGVFAFFWLHSGLWYYRERQEQKKSPPAPYVDLRALGISPRHHVQRFSVGWRVGHLLFALVVMSLVLTGMTLLNAHSFWAPPVTRLLGGVQTMGMIHRVSALLLITIFVIHLVYILYHVFHKPGFRWFGPDSLLPNWQDVTNCRDMFKWFVGRGDKPKFDRWTYFEKFDYWAVFWGITVIGGSGLLLAFPHIAGQYVAGWVFNVATLVHGEEAFLATVFLFTVHFFNNHFRPDKLPPPDIVMFTGSQSLEEFQRDHPGQFQRLVDNGELASRLIPAPSPTLTRGAKILGLSLIGLGFTLLVLVVEGHLGSW